MERTCTCGAVGELHSITCLWEAWTQPHAMVNDHGEVFYPDNAEDAAHFAEHEGARPLHGTEGVLPPDNGGP